MRKQGKPFFSLFPDPQLNPLFVYSLIAVNAISIPFLLIDHRGFRYFGLYLLVAMLLLLLLKNYRLFAVLLVLQIAYIPSVISYTNKLLSQNYNPTYRTEAFIELEEIGRTYLRYEEGLNPWCNSLLVEEDPQPFLTIPGGIGIASKFEDLNTDRYALPLRSRYIILDTYLEGANWQELAPTPFGILYLNLDSDCPPYIYPEARN